MSYLQNLGRAMDAAPKYERVVAADVRPGDRIARAKTHPFHLVTRVDATGVAVWFYLEGAGRIRPNLTAKLWRQVQG